MDELFVFGYGLNKQFPTSIGVGTDRQSGNVHVKSVSTPTPTLRAKQIKILWASWCDLILQVDSTSYRYFGTSLLPAQVAAIEAIPNSSPPPVFFGRSSTSGVLGFLLPSHNSITIFSSPEDDNDRARPVSTYSLAPAPWDILDVQFTAGDAAYVTLQPRSVPDVPSKAFMIEVPSLSYLEHNVLMRLAEYFHANGLELLVETCSQRLCVPFPPSQACSNLSALTVINHHGKVHTFTPDRRFYGTLGRDLLLGPAEEDSAHPIPFLEETVITNIAAGGLYTAAISADGELHMWGQAMSDVDGELCAIRECEEGGDEYVRTLDLCIDGRSANVVDVAVGSACILVATEGKIGDGRVRRAVFAAGSNRHGALGLGEDVAEVGFVEEFTSVDVLQNKKIIQMFCAGSSSFVVAQV